MKKQIYTFIRKEKKRLFNKLFAFAVLIAVAFTPYTSALHSDLEFSGSNVFAAGSLDFSLTSSTANFTPDPRSMRPGATVTRDIGVVNDGSLPLLYRGEYLYVSGDTTLCDALTLTIAKDATTLYTGVLSSFSNFTSPITLNPGSADLLTATISLPSSVSPSLSGKTCSFSIPFFGWQTNTTEALAGFSDSETLDGNVLGTADFEAPPAPVIYQHKNDEVLNSASLVECFDIVTDPQNLHNPVTYEYESYHDAAMTSLRGKTTLTESANKELCGTFGDAIVKHDEGAPEGHVYHRVRAIDTAGNASPWTTEHFLIDNDPPFTSISVSNSPARSINETVINPSFESVDGSGNPTDWDFGGDVRVVGGEFGITPIDGSRVVKIGTDTDPGNEYSFNYISQPIPNSAKNISFWYNFLSYDFVGYDEPGFAVFINDKMVYQMWARDIATGAGPDSSGWKQFLYDISTIDSGSQPILTIVFHAGNTGDTDYQSWVYIDAVSTKDIVVNNSATFTLTASDGLTTPSPWYQLGASGTPVQSATFTIPNRPDGDEISYWSVDQAGNVESHRTLHVIFDNDRPDPIIDLAAVDWTNGDFTLNFTAVNPNDTVTGNMTAASYDIRYATTPITNDTEFEAATATVSASPRPAGENESMWIKGLVPNVQYWFAVKVKDAAPNTSLLESGSTATNGPTVVLNEFLPDPTGGDNDPMPAGEWVELYNNAGYDIDVADWKLYDADNSHELSITTSNTNTGSTVVPANGFLVVYRNGDGDFSLNNTGDAVRLYNKSIGSGGMLIDLTTYTTVTTDKTYARIPDGTGSWVDPKATPGEKNTTEPVTTPIGQHEPDEIPVTENGGQKTEDGKQTTETQSTPTPTTDLSAETSAKEDTLPARNATHSVAGGQPTTSSSSGQILGADSTPTPTPVTEPTPAPTQIAEPTPIMNNE